MTELTQRAVQAHQRRAKSYGFRASAWLDEPTELSGEETLGRRRYVVVRSRAGVLSVYRVRRGRLRRLKRWPAELNTATADQAEWFAVGI